MLSLALMMTIVFVAFLTEATVGFGATILTVTLGAHLLPINVLLPVFVPLNILLSLWFVFHHRRIIDSRYLTHRILPAVGVGMLLGMGIYRFGSHTFLLIAFGVFVVVLSCLELFKELKGTVGATSLKSWKSFAMLGSGGLIHGLFGSGGPMIVYVTGRELQEKSAFRATLAALWLVLNLALVVNYAMIGDLTLETATISALLLPMLALGIALGEYTHRILPQRLFRRVVWLTLLFAAVSLVLRQVV